MRFKVKRCGRRPANRHQCIRVYRDLVQRVHVPIRTLDLLRLLQSGVFLVVDADDRSQPVACAYVEQRGFRAYLGMLSVDPVRQGTGLGRQMMTAVEQYCRGHRVRSIDIRILSLRPELPPFYRKLNFVEEGTAPYENPKSTRPGHFLLMSKNLD